MIRNGNCLVTPGSSLFDGSFGAGQGIHVGHGGVQMQLHTLRSFCGVLPLRQRAGHHGEGLEHHLIVVAVQFQTALHLQHSTQFHVLQNGLGFVCFQEAVDPHGTGIVGDIEADDPGIPLFQLLVVNGKHTALHHNAAHIQLQLPQGRGIALEGLAEEGLALYRGSSLFLLGSFGRNRQSLNSRRTHGIHGIKQSLSFQRLACFYMDGHRRSKALPPVRLHIGNDLLNEILTVGRQLHGQIHSVPFPGSPGKGSPGHGISADEKLHQLRRFHFLQLRFRVCSFQIQLSQAVQTAQRPGHPA